MQENKLFTKDELLLLNTTHDSSLKDTLYSHVAESLHGIDVYLIVSVLDKIRANCQPHLQVDKMPVIEFDCHRQKFL